ncbi:Alpha/Beta hydrolase protein, partial [Mycena epipterygia]
LVWAPLVPQLVKAGHCVLLYDLYGRGYSDAPAGTAYDAQLYVTQLAPLLQHVGWPRARLVDVSMGRAIAAAFVATFPNLVENDVVLVACSGLSEMLTANPLVYVRTPHCISRILIQLPQAYIPPLPRGRAQFSGGLPDPSVMQDPGLMHELVRLQSAYLPGFNRTVSASLHAGPVTGMRWAFESSAWERRRVLVVHVSVSGFNAYFFFERMDSLSLSNFQNTAQTETHSQHVLISGAGHALTWTHAEEVGREVYKFFK